jgi:hypothetical protein
MATQTTAQQQAAQQKELARKLEEYIDKLDRVLERGSKSDSFLGLNTQTVILMTNMNTVMSFFPNNS